MSGDVLFGDPGAVEKPISDRRRIDDRGGIRLKVVASRWFCYDILKRAKKRWAFIAARRYVVDSFPAACGRKVHWQL